MEFFLVLGTWALVGVTIWVAYHQFKSSRSDIKVSLQLKFSERFDNRIFMSDRMELAKEMLQAGSHERISESVMNFFEDIGMYCAKGYLDEELIWNTFGFYIVRWWLMCKDYILAERTLNNDKTLFTDFETLASKMRERDIAAGLLDPSSEDLRTFLKGEAGSFA